MRRTLILLAMISCFAPISSRGQEDSQAKARLIRSRFGGGDVVHYTQEVALIFGDYKTDPNVSAAIRICSKDPMPLALSTAGASPFLMKRYLTEFYDYPPERIVFLCSEGCLGSEPAPALTESWLVPKGAAFPSSVESIKSCQVSLESLSEGVEKGEDIHSAAEYEATLMNFAEKLKARPRAVGIILGGYNVDVSDRIGWRKYNRPRALMRQRLREANDLLKKAGVSQERFFSRVHPRVTLCANDCGPGEPQPTYPELLVIEIKNDCGS